MPLFSLKALEDAHQLVQKSVPPTPTHAWPLLQERTGLEVFVKHENHTPTGSFKARGGLVYVHQLLQSHHKPLGLVTATRGNHGQSIALSATRNGMVCRVVVPKGNSEEKNAAMCAFGAEVIEAGEDFDESRKVAQKIHEDDGFASVPPFHETLVIRRSDICVGTVYAAQRSGRCLCAHRHGLRHMRFDYCSRSTRA